MRGQRTQSEIDTRGRRRAAGVWLLSAGIAGVISGCGASVTGSQTQALQLAPAAAAPSSSPAESIAPADTSTADALASSIADALDALAARSPEPDAEALRGAFAAAGADASSVEVSIDITPTGLEVDAMTGAVPVGESCVFGHIRDGVASVTQLPLLADGRCFVGDQR